MTEIAVRQDNAPATIPHAAAGLVEWAQAAQAAHTLARSLVETAFVPQQYRGKPAEATAAILAGAELGLNPLAALRAFDNIQGTAAPKAITLRAVAQSHGHDVEVSEESDLKAVVEYRRKGSDNWRTVTWTIQQARDMGLVSKDNWKKQPKSMLVARATSEASRRVASDALLGIPYSSEELQDSIPEPTAKVARAPRTVQRQPKPEAPEPEFDEPQPAQEPVKATAERADDGISDAQLKAVNAGLTSLGIKDRDAKLAMVSQIIDREIESSKDLTRAEASVVIDWIKTEESNAPVEPPLDGLQ